MSVCDFRLDFILSKLTSPTPHRYVNFGMTHNHSRGRTVRTSDRRYICVSAVESSNLRLNESGSRFGIRVKLVGPESAGCRNVIVRLCLLNRSQTLPATRCLDRDIAPCHEFVQMS
ncbi:hypothetical protein [Heliothis virescens ascovirus 3j]|uniref:Uncharacterized protein n=1 Tax=Heliothis virescens ascovirus 3j TaxID=1561067 RepID=A0A2Z5UZK0_9VIRU|nr:hypothetical protein [Heliothis virescens ascovirus 3j]